MTNKYKVLNEQVLQWFDEIKVEEWGDDEYESFLHEMDDYFVIGKEHGLGEWIDACFSDENMARMMYMSFCGGYDYGREYMWNEINAQIEAEDVLDHIKNERQESNQA